MVLCYTHGIVLHTWYCATHMVLCYTHDTVLHTWYSPTYSPTYMVQCYTHGTTLYTWYCATHMVLCYTRYCATHTVLRYTHTKYCATHTQYCATHMVLCCDARPAQSQCEHPLHLRSYHHGQRCPAHLVLHKLKSLWHWKSKETFPSIDCFFKAFGHDNRHMINI